MLKFLRESIKEFDHVVWPTRAETTRYFGFVTTVIIALGLFLFVASSLITTGLFAARGAIAPASTYQPTNSSSSQSPLNLSDISFESGAVETASDAKKAVSVTGSTVPTTASGTQAVKVSSGSATK